MLQKRLEENKWYTSTVQELFCETCKMRQSKIAIIYNDKEISYAELQENVNKCTQALMELGVKRGDHVAMLPSPTPEFVYIYFGALQAGAVVNPLNLSWGIIEFTGIFKRNDPKVIIAVDKYMKRDYIQVIRESIPDLKVGERSVSSATIPTLCHMICASRHGEKYEGFLDFGEFLFSGAGYREKDIEEAIRAGKNTDIQFICQTSGSTGLSKSALWNHRSPLSSSHFTIKAMNFSEEDLMLNTLPLYHSGGINLLNLVLALSGATIFLNELFDPIKCLELIDRYGINSTIGFDAHWQGMRKAMDGGNYKFTIKKALTACSPQTFKMVHDEMCKTRDVNIIQLYAQTENGPMIAFVEPDCVVWSIRQNTNGRPLAGVELVIKDIDTGEKLGPQKQGEICYKSPYLFQGYYKQEEETRKLFDDEGYFHSGDYGTFDNGYLIWMGRLGGVVKSGGENVSTAYVSSLLIKLFPDEFEDVQTFGVPDVYWGTKIVSWVRMKPGKGLRPLKEITADCKGKMANYEIPKEILKWEGEWPMTSVGKIDTKVLLEEIKKAVVV